jgi:hypothetical protein
MNEENFFNSLKNFKYVFNENDYYIFKKHIGNPYSPDEEAKRNMSLAKKGKKNSAEHIERARLARIGKKQTEYQKQRARECKESAWVLTTPEGLEINIVNLRKFCIDNGLDQGNMVKVSQGILKQHKGWKCYKIT